MIADDRWLLGSVLLAILVYGGVVFAQCRGMHETIRAVESELAE